MKLVAENFGVTEKDVRNWPDEKLLATAAQIIKSKGSGENGKGQGPSFE